MRTPSSLEATGASENDVQVMIPVSDEELVAPTMAGFGTPEVPLDGSRFEAYRFPTSTCPEYAEAVAPRPVPSASNMTTAELANAMEVLSLLNRVVGCNKWFNKSNTMKVHSLMPHRLMSRGPHRLQLILSNLCHGVLM